MEMLQVLLRNFSCSGPEVLTLKLGSGESGADTQKCPWSTSKRGTAKTPDPEKSCNSNIKFDREIESLPNYFERVGL